MKFYFSILFIFLNFTVFAQNILKDLQNYKTYQLPNGMTILAVQTKEYKYLNYRITINFNPQYDAYPSIMEFWAAYNGFEQNGKTQIFANKVSDTNAIDSMFIFFFENIFTYKPNNLLFQTTKEVLKRRYATFDINENENWLVAQKFCFGKKSIYARSLDTLMLDYYSQMEFEDVYKNTIVPQNITIAVVGDVNPDTVFKYAVKNFSTIKQETKPLAFLPESATLPKTRLSLYEDTTNSYFSISYPLNFFYTDNDFWEKAVAFEVFRQRIEKDMSAFSDDVTFETPILHNGSYFRLSLKYSPEGLYDQIFQSTLTMNEFLTEKPSNFEVQDAKNKIIKQFEKSLKNPYKIAEYLTIINQYKIDRSYFYNVKWTINKIQVYDVKKAINENIKPNNAAIVISGPQEKLICQMYKLASLYSVDFIDKELHKYKIIPFGFDCDYIFNSYLSSCGLNNEIPHYTMEYGLKYFLDTVYTGSAIQYFKTPNLYYYKSLFYIDNDTLMELLQIFNGKKFYQKDAVGEFTSKDDSIYFPLIWDNYLFQEKLFAAFGYDYEFVCDTALLKKNIFKIKITTPYNVYFYNYYNFDRKEKYRTEIIRLKGNVEDTLSVIFYTNYRMIDKKSGIKLPYTIEEHRKGVVLDMSLKSVNMKAKLDKHQFDIPKTQ